MLYVINYHLWGINSVVILSTGTYKKEAVSMGYSDGMVKVIADADTNKILGMHIVGPHARVILKKAKKRSFLCAISQCGIVSGCIWYELKRHMENIRREVSKVKI